MESEIENQISGIKIVDRLNSGSQKDVYKIISKDYGDCVLKIVRTDTDVDRVIREIQIVTKYDIPNVPKIYNTGEINFNGNRCIYIIEQFIKGNSLREILIKKQKLNLKEAYSLLETLLITESKLEEYNVIHRDIKPENILISDNKYYLIDFGIAKALDMKSLTFVLNTKSPHTPGYGAPELLNYYENRNIDSRADLFSIGVVIYECIFGVNPYRTGTEQSYNEIWYKTITVIPERLQIKGDTQQQFMGLIETLMMKPISKRPSSAKKALEWLYGLKETLVIGDE